MENIKDYKILVNKTNECPDKLPFTIVDVHSTYADNRYAELETFKAFNLLRQYARACGYDIDIVSGYRSKEHQQRVFDKITAQKGLEYAKQYVAFPGCSEHQTGLALDLCLKRDDKFYIEHYLPEDFKEFIKNNIYKFGFILRYPEGKEEITGYKHEPWHIRFIDDSVLAKYLFENNLCLEEYLELDKEKPKVLTKTSK